MISYKTFTPESHVLTEEGSSIARDGSHEYRFWAALSSEVRPLKDVEAALGKDVAKIGQGKAMRNKWVAKSGDGFVRAVRRRLCWGQADGQIRRRSWSTRPRTSSSRCCRRAR